MTEAHPRWPKRGDKAFAPCIPNAMKARLEAFVIPSMATYTLGFRWAAANLTGDTGVGAQSPEDLFLPAAYLYRHYLELELKGLVALGVRLGALDKCDCCECLKHHNLHRLWGKAMQLIRECWPDSPERDLAAVERVILEFHKIDPTGQAFRYASDTEGQPHLKDLPPSIDLLNLRETMEAVANFLEATETGIDACDPGPR